MTHFDVNFLSLIRGQTDRALSFSIEGFQVQSLCESFGGENYYSLLVLQGCFVGVSQERLDNKSNQNIEFWTKSETFIKKTLFSGKVYSTVSSFCLIAPTDMLIVIVP